MSVLNFHVGHQSDRALSIRALIFMSGADRVLCWWGCRLCSRGRGEETEGKERKSWFSFVPLVGGGSGGVPAGWACPATRGRRSPPAGAARGGGRRNDPPPPAPQRAQP